MNYPYPIPGSSSAAPVYTGPYFQVGNECCNGGMTNDIDAVTKVVFDYTYQLPSGVNVNTIAYEVTPSVDQMLVVSNKVLSGNIATFMVSGGTVGQSYSIETLATLSDGQVWVDHIAVMVTDCDANIGVGNGLLFTYGPIVLANTLYYDATAGQTVFSLSTPDEFNRVGVLVNNNALVYVNGLRQEPVDDYTVNAGHNTITFMHPLAASAEVVFDLVSSPPPLIPPVLLNDAIVATTLYYVATAGQNVFYLSTPDEFNNVGVMTANEVQVYRSGNRLVPVDAYTLDVANNRVLLVYPAGVGEPIIIELINPAPPPVLSGTVPRMESLTIATVNVLPNLSFAPDGNMTMLFVNGTAFFPPTAFTVNGKTLTWVSTSFSVPVGAAVFAVYTHA